MLPFVRGWPWRCPADWNLQLSLGPGDSAGILPPGPSFHPGNETILALHIRATLEDGQHAGEILLQIEARLFRHD